MASITLAEAKKLGLDDLSAGLAESIITVNPLYSVLPWNLTKGNAYVFNRENVLGDAQVIGIDGTITAKAAATVTQVSQPLTTIIGDAEINQLLVAQGVGNDITASQVASKAKSIGRKYQDLLVNGDSGTANEFDGLVKLINSTPFSAQKIDTVALDLAVVEELLDMVTSKGSSVDALMANSAVIRALNAKLRALGGATIEYVKMGEARVPMFNGIPIFRNDYIGSDVDGVTAGNQSYIFAFNFDDGSRTQGIAGVMPADVQGLQVQAVGASETKDNEIFRVKMYSTFAVHSVKSLAGAIVTY